MDEYSVPKLHTFLNKCILNKCLYKHSVNLINALVDEPISVK